MVPLALGVQTMAWQFMLAQSAFALHLSVFAHGGQAASIPASLASTYPVPPQSESVSLPFCTWSVHDGREQVLAVVSQILFVQSVPTAHFKPSAQGAQLPPQSTSVSSASFVPSVQWAALQTPEPSQTLLVPSHAVPLAASVLLHV